MRASIKPRAPSACRPPQPRSDGPSSPVAPLHSAAMRDLLLRLRGDPPRLSNPYHLVHRLFLPLPTLPFVDTAPLMPIEHILNHRPNLPRNTFLPEHTPGSQVVEVGRALGVRGLLAGREDRQQQFAADRSGGFFGLAATRVHALGCQGYWVAQAALRRLVCNVVVQTDVGSVNTACYTCKTGTSGIALRLSVM